ncbi:MAG: phosphoribosylglycinamide formyltransferase [Oscillospiraceae bacterium]|jgi:phosphoribosylglycinamide formyltransferase-1|nr:phosphoribosylglycinamide formyltransferase [Oscillospiraceae bacterium]
MTRTAILVSGGGTNLQALIDAKQRGELPDTEFVGVISSSPDAYALERAKLADIPRYVVDIAEYSSPPTPPQRRGQVKDALLSEGGQAKDTPLSEGGQAKDAPLFEGGRGGVSPRERFTDAIVDILNGIGAELVITAGFLYITTPRFVNEYSGRIINIHPSLLPAFGGAGCYGIHVHEKVLAYGVKVTGATTHFVTQEPDTGPIILQKAVEVLPEDTPETLQLRVMRQAEWRILPEAVALYCSGRLRVNGRIVTVEKLSV